MPKAQSPKLQTLNPKTLNHKPKTQNLKSRPWQEQCVGYGLVNFVSAEASGVQKIIGTLRGVRGRGVGDYTSLLWSLRPPPYAPKGPCEKSFQGFIA